MVSQGFSDLALRGSEPHVLEHVKHLCSRLLGPAEESESMFQTPMKDKFAIWTEPKDLAVWGMRLQDQCIRLSKTNME